MWCWCCPGCAAARITSRLCSFTYDRQVQPEYVTENTSISPSSLIPPCSSMPTTSSLCLGLARPHSSSRSGHPGVRLQPVCVDVCPPLHGSNLPVCRQGGVWHHGHGVEGGCCSCCPHSEAHPSSPSLPAPCFIVRCFLLLLFCFTIMMCLLALIYLFIPLHPWQTFPPGSRSFMNLLLSCP